MRAKSDTQLMLHITRCQALTFTSNNVALLWRKPKKDTSETSTNGHSSLKCVGTIRLGLPLFFISNYFEPSHNSRLTTIIKVLND